MNKPLFDTELETVKSTQLKNNSIWKALVKSIWCMSFAVWALCAAAAGGGCTNSSHIRHHLDNLCVPGREECEEKKKKTLAAALNTYPKLRAHGGSIIIARVTSSKWSKGRNEQNNEAFRSFISIHFADVKPPEPHDATKLLQNQCIENWMPWAKPNNLIFFKSVLMIFSYLLLLLFQVGKKMWIYSNFTSL